MNHLWQSTLFAGVVGLLTLVLRKNPARVRYWLWVAASAKFLIPFSLLVALGSQVPLRNAPAAVPLPVFIEYMAQPVASAEPAHPVLGASRAIDPWRLGLVIWAAGSLLFLVRWSREWLRLRTILRSATPLNLGIPAEARSSPALLEPGVFGIWRPVLLLPEGIIERLAPAELRAILAHELCHARHRDNLFAALHMGVEALFWFHPLTWWIGRRMLQEREQACDEEVLRQGSQPEIYAEGILKVCESYLHAPLACMPGVAGADLKKRIEAIMTSNVVRKLNARRKLLLAVAGILTVMAPVGFGILNAPAVQAQSPAASVTFEAASVKQLKNPTRTDLRFPAFLPGGKFSATAPLINTIGAAYGLPFNIGPRLSGGPAWIRSEDGVYHIEAVTGKGAVPDGLPASVRTARMRAALQGLLADRFHLVIRRETREMPIYALLVGKGGPKLQQADIAEKDCPDVTPGPNVRPGDPVVACHVFLGGQGRGLHARAADMGDLASFVENWSGRPLLDKTGIQGLYRIETQGWLPMQAGPPATDAKSESGLAYADLPTLFQVMEGLGLKMEAQTDKVDVFVIDHIERPTEN